MGCACKGHVWVEIAATERLDARGYVGSYAERFGKMEKCTLTVKNVEAVDCLVELIDVLMLVANCNLPRRGQKLKDGEGNFVEVAGFVKHNEVEWVVCECSVS